MKAIKGYFTVLFYESLNKNCQAKQMDLHKGQKGVAR